MSSTTRSDGRTTADRGCGRSGRVLAWTSGFFFTASVIAVPLAAVTVPERTGVGQKEFRHAGLTIDSAYLTAERMPAPAAARASAELAALGLPADRGHLDARSGRWATVLPAQPLVPGSGVGNELAWSDLGTGVPASENAIGRAAWQAFRGYLQTHAASLHLDVAELPEMARVTVHGDGTLIQIHAARVVRGVPVRDSYVSATVNHGNLVLFGAHQWGDIDVSLAPDLTQEAALAVAQAHVEPYAVAGAWGKSELVLVPTARDTSLDKIHGRGYAYRLAWVVRPSFENDLGRWEALVDAHSGELLAFEDTNQYATTRQVKGGVYPETNDGVGPEGVEQAGWPMPFCNVTSGGNTYTTDSGGNLLQCVDGTITSQLRGPFMLMNDNCGAISLSGSGDLDFGTSGGTDCTTPGFGGPGNTHSSRSGFYEMNRIKEMARAQLPGNTWLPGQLQANMNINQTCNAFWGGGTVNFYRFGGGCNNTGELAGVFDHEWGHGMDDNDATPGISNPGEGIADIYAALRLGTSCIGRGFRLGTNCGGYGDPCTQCDGVRDIDWAKRASGTPHTFTWANANCGGGVHCRGYVYSEAVWDLWKRDLAAAPFNLDNNTALEIVTRMTYVGAGGVGTWYSGSPPFGGCAATSGYQKYLAADDDNGNLADGTPHMTAIFNAFNRHEIACNTLTVQNSGCAGTPGTAPVVTATALDRGARLTWGAVSGATSYEVFRTDGVFACNYGKTKVATTTGTSFTDSGLQNGRNYYYTVIAKGPAASCFGPASACATVTPVAGANLHVDAASAALAISSGDGDVFIDNCESATLSFDVINIGTAQTSVRIVDVRPVSHPAISITTPLPASVSPSSLAACATGTGSFSFSAAGLAFGDTVTFEVDVTSDQLAPIVKTQTLKLTNAESDLQFMASKTWDFESDLEGWTLVQGTFNRASTGGGAGGSSWYVRSSSLLHNQCDQIRSPALRLTATSTLTASTNFDIENFSGGSWWDRANVAVLDGGVRSARSPDSGRLYNASGAGAVCVTAGQAGWAASQPTWATSGWSASALGSAALAGKTVQLDIAYGTDVSVVGDGFRFDRVTVTDVQFIVPDGQSDVCTTCGDGTCDPGEDRCSCPADCGAPPATETGLCTDSADNDCDGFTDCADSDCAGDPACVVTCDNDGTCEAGEDCNNCANDCISGTTSGAVCGNGICEVGNGENCVNCAADCNGQQGGKPSGRFCCGNGGQNPVGCGDNRCTTGGFQCTTTPSNQVNYCCGDAVCNGAENSSNCALDCGPAPFCGDGTCNGSENQCSCAVDCGTPPASETGLCTDGSDNDCDTFIDCADTDCASDPACVVCVPKGGSCTQNSQCCSGTCKGNGTCR